eukprot:TRINITY_DN671_c0_g1_i2.p1 TRINITY_DN671_c0_g1~~TRINITY_DN671_c0_g1_i2.p1  ORF type:complete len:599 (-),score=147.21 TRINITY_DN671_c0_g1_i2:49-1665(-)
MMGGGGGRKKPTEWPKSESSEIEPEFEWLVNTEWKGKTATYMLLRDGIVESSLKECEHEGQCLWAANGGKVLINTPTLKVIKFTVENIDKVDRKKLEDKDETELKKISFLSEKASKSGKKSQLEFSKVATADDATEIIARDLYEVLDVAEDADASTIKSKFRRLSVQNHPDKGGDPKVFAEIREAYEVLSNQDSRRYYNIGGLQLAKNVELGYKEGESQASQLDAKLQQVPKNHPQYKMAKAQIDQQKQQFEKSHLKSKIEKQLTSDDLDVYVPISAKELYSGVPAKSFVFKRLVICRGCRADPTAPKCQDCGRCPPEKVKVPKYGMTPFGRQVVGMREKEQESRERCREMDVKVDNLRVAKGAKPGATLRNVGEIGHQTPGKLPGRVVFKVQHGSPTDQYTIAEEDLHTVLKISLEEALFGFTKKWDHLGDGAVTISRSRTTQPGEVVVFKKKGLVKERGGRGNMYVRLDVELPEASKGSSSLTLNAPTGDVSAPRLSREDTVEIREGNAWRLWGQRETATLPDEKHVKKSGGKTEL